MAHRAGVRCAWAHYGTFRRNADEELLARLCHWTPSETEADMAVTRELAVPEIVLERDLSEIMAHHEFVC